jgi:hypothetical protein
MVRRNLVLLIGVVTVLFGCREPEPGRSRLKLDSTPPSEVILNGESMGETPLSLRLPPGRYDVIFRLTGYEDYEDSFPLPAHAEVEIHPQLVASGSGSTTAPDPGLVREVKAVSDDLQAFFADLGIEPPGALREFVTIADSGKLPTAAEDLERFRTMLEGLAGAVDTIGTEPELAGRLRGLSALLK